MGNLAIWQFGVVMETLTGGAPCMKSLTDILKDILFEGKLQEEWMLSLLVPIVKGKGNPLYSELVYESKFVRAGFQFV